jgi:acetyl/propionyl-CoA carboxylase alpha subunit
MAPRHRFQLNGETHNVIVDQHGVLTSFTIDDGEPVIADATLSGVPGLISMMIDGRPFRAYVTREGRDFRVTVGDRTFLIASAGGGKRGRSSVGGATDLPGTITAPLAGVLVERRVAVGDTIEEGQAVLVVEAMKMQNEIQTPHAGTVTAIHFEAGARVEKGAILLEYDPADQPAPV